VKIKIILLFISLLMILPAQAKKIHYERWYQKFQCNALGGITEFRPAKDRFVRVDCELPNYSIEVDFSSAKQYEAIGQSLYYSHLTGKKAGIWLIIEKQNDIKHAIRMVRNIRGNKLPITVWLQRYRIGKTPNFEIYYQPSVNVGKFEKLMEYGRKLETQNN